MPLELDHLRSAIASLERSLGVARSPLMESGDEAVRETIQAVVIQHFEVAYELCWKLMQRWLKANIRDAEFPRTRKKLFREAARQRLIEFSEPWFEFTESRNLTMHIYTASGLTICLSKKCFAVLP